MNLDPAAFKHAVLSVACEVRRVQTAPNWRVLTEGQLWRELVACILGSATTYESARQALDRLDERGLLTIKRGMGTARWQEQARATLALSGYRFPRIRAAHIGHTAMALYREKAGIRAILEASCTAEHARSSLVVMTCGMGPKQASLYLRNIGYSSEIAVLDTHVLRYMRMFGATRLAIPPPTIATYAACEAEFRGIARELNLPVTVADLSIWVVMRVAARGESSWQS